MKNTILDIRDLEKYYSRNGYSLQVLNNISFQLHENELLGILGPLGSGKSTLLRIVAGIEGYSQTGDKESNIEFKSKKPIAFIPSNPSSLPWLNVRQNIEYAVKITGQVIDNNFITKIIDVVGLTGYEEHMPDNRSIGFRFRVSLGRALAIIPTMILIDEPFFKLDEITRQELLMLLRTVKNEFKTSIIFSTSNISEAIFISDRILMLGKTPTTVLGAINIDLPLSRDLNTFAVQMFFDLRTKIEMEFKSELPNSLNSFLV